MQMNNAQRINQTSGQVEWYTPSEIIEAARRTMGSIDLDPASCAVANRTVQSEHYFTVEDDGLYRCWWGNVWLNWPYSRSGNQKWPAKLIAEYETGHIAQACCITFASTSESWFQPLLRYPVCFLAGRTCFIDGKTGQAADSPPKGCAVFTLGGNVESFIREFAQLGSVCIPAIETAQQAQQITLALT